MFSWPGREDSNKRKGGQGQSDQNKKKSRASGFHPNLNNLNNLNNLSVLQARKDVDELMQKCKRVWTNPTYLHTYIHTNEPKVHLGVNWTTAELITLLRNVGDIGEYKSRITLTIGSDGFSIKSEPLSDAQKSSRIECTEEVVDKLLPGLLSSAATFLPDPWDFTEKGRIASKIAPEPSLLKDPATINLPELLKPLTITEVVELDVSDSLPKDCHENGSVLGCLWDASAFQFQPFDLSFWPAAVKFADKWLQEPVAWWQQIMPSVKKVWVLTESTPECRQAGAIDQRHQTCWMVAVLNLFARVSFLFLMLDKRLQELVLGCEHIQSDGNNILQTSMPTRQACPRLPEPFHSYMQEEHGDWPGVNVHSGWSCEKLLRGMLEFSGYKYKDTPKEAPNGPYWFNSTIIASDCTRKDCTVLEYKYRYKKFNESTTPFSLEWLTQKCSRYEAGLFSFWKDDEQLGHAVALTMCKGEVLVCDHGSTYDLTFWLDWSDLTTLSSLTLVLYRRRIDSTGNDAMSDVV